MDLRLIGASGITPGWGESWETLANAINGYYGGPGYAQYEKVAQYLNTGEYTVEEMESILQQIPGLERTYNANGELVNVAYRNTATSSTTSNTIAQQINSNASAGTQTQFSTTQTITKDAQTDVATISDDVTKYNSGTATTIKSLSGSVIAAILAASAGISAGKIISSGLYNVLPLIFEDANVMAFNPETWASITAGDNSFGAKLFNMIFHIDPTTGNPQAYVNETAYAYMIAYMASLGFFELGQPIYPEPQTTGDIVLSNRVTPYDLLNMTINSPRKLDYSAVSSTINDFINTYYDEDKLCILSITKVSSAYEGWSPLTIYISENSYPDNTTFTLGEGIPVHVLETRGRGASGETIEIFDTRYQSPSPVSGVSFFAGTKEDVNMIYYSNINAEEGEQPPEGVTNQPGAIIFDPTSIPDLTNINAVLNALMQQYPELWNNRIELSPDGQTVVKYIPVPFPTAGTGTQPTTENASQSKTSPDIQDETEEVTDSLIKTLIDIIQHPKENNGMEDDTEEPSKPVDPNKEDVGTGTTPAVVLPTGSAKSLYAIYNPDQGQLDSFGSWLWSSDFVDQLLKVFNDPMQAIIGLHKIFATPTTSGTDTIHVGYLDSHVNSKVVGNQYVTIDCGTVSIPEYFNNVFDYDPFTTVSIYLPFIGIKRLNTGDVMRSSINVKYHIDVITGACLAEVSVTRDLSGGILYTYAGNCAVQYPLSSGSYMGIVSGALGLAGSVASTIISGGAMLPMALGVGASALSSAKTKVEHSGALSGNAGAMGCKKPYIIISRPQTATATNFPLFNGYPANSSVVLNQCTGFIKCDEVHVENIPATSDELSKIETLLKSGILISG